MSPLPPAALPRAPRNLATQQGQGLPALFTPTPAAQRRYVEFFTANIRNPNTRKSYARAAAEFSALPGRLTARAA